MGTFLEVNITGQLYIIRNIKLLTKEDRSLRLVRFFVLHLYFLNEGNIQE